MFSQNLNVQTLPHKSISGNAETPKASRTVNIEEILKKKSNYFFSRLRTPKTSADFENKHKEQITAEENAQTPTSNNPDSGKKSRTGDRPQRPDGDKEFKNNRCPQEKRAEIGRKIVP